jgi:hypothetical protein
MSPPPPQRLPPKKEVALALLERSSVHVYLDPRSKEVVVPPWLAKQPRLVLQIGLNMPVPIPDLRLDDDAMTCTLSFNHSPFLCVVPWASVFAMVGDDSRGMVWPDDVPPELASEGAARPLEVVPAPARSASKKDARPALVEAQKPAVTKPRRSRKKAGDSIDGAKAEAKVDAKVVDPKVEGRARPVAVPARASAPRALPQPVAATPTDSAPASPRSQPQPQPQTQKAPQSAPQNGKRAVAGKAKRELPPYLRVVK